VPPSLLTLLTGLQPYQAELWLDQHHRREPARTNGNWIRELDTLPALLAQRGYRSMQAGKHWEASAEWAGFTTGTKGEHPAGRPIQRLSGGAEGLEVGRSTMQPVWDFLEAAPREPFFLWFAPLLPHAPQNAPKEIRDRYAGLNLARSAHGYYANISWLDDSVGMLIAKLDELGVLDRTLVVYLADNGWDNATDVDYTKGRGLVLGGVRGKTSMRELGLRTPVIFRWPGRIPAGRRRDDLLSTIDLFPTLLGYAGLLAPSGREGIDLRDALMYGGVLPERTVYGHVENALSQTIAADAWSWKKLRRQAFFARNEDWHYIDFPNVKDGPFGPEQELFDVRADPEEAENVAAVHPNIVRELGREIEAWRRRMQRTLPNQRDRRGAWSDPDAQRP
jgi:arylsulfatase A-like enzyme